MQRANKKYKLETKTEYGPFYHLALEKWPSISSESPTEADLGGLAYKLAVSFTDKIFDKFTEHLRVFQDTSLDITFDRLIVDEYQKPTHAVYIIDMILLADKFEPKPEDGNFEIMQGQMKLNQEFIALIGDLDVAIAGLGTPI